MLRFSFLVLPLLLLVTACTIGQAQGRAPVYVGERPPPEEEEANRMDCRQINGSQYLSEAEHDWWWANCTDLRTSLPTPQPKPDCDPSYPSICIGRLGSDLECKDIPFRDFPVQGRDRHRFDGDKNGIGCETKDRR